MDRTTRTHWIGKPALLILACYWLALTIGTHWPLPPHVLGIGDSDKALHLTAYFGLAVLVCLNWSLRWPFGWAAIVGIVAALSVHGALDELTQIPVGRHANFYDWVADCAGAAAGVGLFAVIGSLCRRTRRQQTRTAKTAAETTEVKTS